jgi:hypothetical protein
VGAHRSGGGCTALAAIPLGSPLPHPHRPLWPEVPPRSAAVHYPSASVAQQAVWVQLCCRISPRPPQPMADALSRRDSDSGAEDAVLHTLSAPSFSLLDEIHTTTGTDDASYSSCVMPPLWRRGAPRMASCSTASVSLC